MGCCKFFIIACLICFGSFFYFVYLKKPNYKLSNMADQYWGPQMLKVGEPLPKDDSTIRPLKVAYDEDVVKELHERLNRTKFPEPLQGANFEYGFNGDYLKKLVHYWRHNYDWKKEVEYLNQYHQFTTQIEGITIHFVRIRALGRSETVKPILLMNGWPSNFYQFYKLAELLRKPLDDVAFEVILPSRPGFGYSERPHREGFSIADSARIYVKLMRRLGHVKFFYHGEDWGAAEGHVISALYPEALFGVHSSMSYLDTSLKGLIKIAAGTVAPSLVYSDEFEAKTFSRPINIIKLLARETGYFFMQSAKPDTLAALLLDSPAGLAAYCLEKFSAGLDRSFVDLPDGGLTKKFTWDELLTNLMIFYTTGNGGYSIRYYKDFVNKFLIGEDAYKIPADPRVPFGFSVGEHEIDVFKMKPVGIYNIVKFDYLIGIGHFPSFENPVEVHEHLRKFVSIVLDQQNNDHLKTEL